MTGLVTDPNRKSFLNFLQQLTLPTTEERKSTSSGYGKTGPKDVLKVIPMWSY